MQDFTTLNNQSAVPVEEVLMWTLVLLLGVLLVAVVARLIGKNRKGNELFYQKKGALNLRVEKVPDLRIATKHCKNFLIMIHGRTMLLSYENPIGGVKEFKCKLVGAPVKDYITITLNENEFKKFCRNLKEGNLAITGSKILVNYNLTVRISKMTKAKKEA